MKLENPAGEVWFRAGLRKFYEEDEPMSSKKKKILSALLASSMLVSQVSVVAFAEGDTEGEESGTGTTSQSVSEIKISLDAPTAGQALATSATVAEGQSGYKVDSVSWKLGEEEATGEAGYNKAYTAIITVLLADATESTTYAWGDTVSATLNGSISENVTVANVEGETNKKTVTYTFAATDNADYF